MKRRGVIAALVGGFSVAVRGGQEADSAYTIKLSENGQVGGAGTCITLTSNPLRSYCDITVREIQYKYGPGD